MAVVFRFSMYSSSLVVEGGLGDSGKTGCDAYVHGLTGQQETS